MRYRCSKCGRPPVHNRKLGIRFCRAHGLSAVPVMPGRTRTDRDV